MSLLDQFLWVIFPYLSLVIFVLGHVYRYYYDQYGWTPKSSQLLERRLLMWGAVLFHWGLLFVLIGHAMGLLVPIEVYRTLGVSDHDYHLLALWAGTLFGAVALVGILLLNLRRWFVSRIRSNTEWMRFVSDGLLLVVILSGLAATVGYRVYAAQYDLPAEFEYRENIAPWFRSLFYFSPDSSLMLEVPLMFQLHVLLAFGLFALWPFSSLVHAFSMPLGYLRRRYIQYRSVNPRAAHSRGRYPRGAPEPAAAGRERPVRTRPGARRRGLGERVAGLAATVRWQDVLLGWAVAIFTGIAINLLFEGAHRWFFAGGPLDRTSLTTALVTISLVSGFLAHFVGGYVAGRRAGTAGGLHGIMIALAGLALVLVAAAGVAAILAATAGAVIVEGVTVPPLTLGLAGSALSASLALFALNLLGGYFGGKLGEWEFGLPPFWRRKNATR